MGSIQRAATVAILCCCAAAQGGDLGRLFTTTQERRQLDRLPGETDLPVHRVIPMQGISARRGGEPTAWVDGRRLQRGEAGKDFVLLDAGQEGALILRDSTALPNAAEDDIGASR